MYYYVSSPILCWSVSFTPVSQVPFPSIDLKSCEKWIMWTVPVSLIFFSWRFDFLLDVFFLLTLFSYVLLGIIVSSCDHE